LRCVRTYNNGFEYWKADWITYDDKSIKRYLWIIKDELNRSLILRAFKALD